MQLPYVKRGLSEPIPAEFSGTRKEMALIYLKAFLPLILTLGLYRFWQTTKLRHYLWKNIIFDTEALEYIGTGKELFKGFLIALCFLVPLNIGFTLGSLTAFSLYIFLGLSVVGILFAGFGTFAGRRYRLNRTLWRGIRFSMRGSAWKFAFYYVGWFFLTLLTLGLISPFATAWQERYKMRFTQFGSVQGAFNGTGKGLFIKLLPITIITFLPLFGIIYQLFSGITWNDFRDILAAIQTGDEKVISDTFRYSLGDSIVGLMWKSFALFMGWLFLYMLCIPALKAIKFNWWANGLTLGNTQLTANFKISTSYKIWAKFFLISMALSTAFSIILAILGTAFSFIDWKSLLQYKDLLNSPIGKSLIIAGGALFYVSVFFLTALMKNLFITYSYMRDQVNSVQIHNLHSLEDVLAHSQNSNALGEALADQDFGGFGV